MNPVAEDITGWIKEEAIGESLDEVLKISEDDFISANQKIESTVYYESIITTKHGTELQIKGTFTPVKDEFGNFNGLILVFQRIQSYIISVI